MKNTILKFILLAVIINLNLSSAKAFDKEVYPSTTTQNIKPNYTSGIRERITERFISECVKNNLNYNNYSGQIKNENDGSVRNPNNEASGSGEKVQANYNNSSILNCMLQTTDAIYKEQFLNNSTGSRKEAVRVNIANCPSMIVPDNINTDSKKDISTRCMYTLPSTESGFSVEVTNFNRDTLFCKAKFRCQNDGRWIKDEENLFYTVMLDGKRKVVGAQQVNSESIKTSMKCESTELSFSYNQKNYTTTVGQAYYNKINTSYIHDNETSIKVEHICVNPFAIEKSLQWGAQPIITPIEGKDFSNVQGYSVVGDLNCDPNDLIDITGENISWYGEVWNETKSNIVKCSTRKGIPIIVNGEASFTSEWDNITNGEFFSNRENAGLYNTFTYGEITYKCINGNWIKTSQKCQNTPSDLLEELFVGEGDWSSEEVKQYQRKTTKGETYYIYKKFKPRAGIDYENMINRTPNDKPVVNRTIRNSDGENEQDPTGEATNGGGQ